MIVDLALTALSPAGSRQRLSVLIFHRVLAEPDELHHDLPDVHAYDRLLGWVARWFRVLPLDQAVRRWRDGRLPARAAAITFDDGYADNLLQAAPLLNKHGLSATFFIATGFLDGGRMWNDSIAEGLRGCRERELDLQDLGLGRHPLTSIEARRAAVATLLPQVKYLPSGQREQVAEEIGQRCGVPLPEDLMMSSQQLRALRDAGMQIGAHTVNHPILANCTREQAAREIGDSRRRLEQLLEQPVPLFAYPNGVPGRDYTAETVALIREAGFEAAMTTAAGAARAGSDPYQLPRFTPWDQTPQRFGLRMVRNLLQQEARLT